MPTIREARQQFFRTEGLPADGGYTDPWFDASFGPVSYRIRNFDLRADALMRHDVHHTLTGYATDWRGEVEINAWEFGAGLGNQPWGWVIMLMGFFFGVLLSPAATFQAFARGRRSTNLYRGPLDPDILERDLDSVRASLSVVDTVRPTLRDGAVFLGASILSCMTAAVLFLPLLGLVLHASLLRIRNEVVALTGELASCGPCCAVAA